MSFFEPATWVACFVEFFYGDCAPNLDRPVKIGWRRLFRYLMNREELEYHLASDQEDPLIPGGRYIGLSQSRWNTPEFAAVFVDTVRKLEVLQSTRVFSRSTRRPSPRICGLSPKRPTKISSSFRRTFERASEERKAAAA